MPGLRSARGRTILAGVVLVVVLAGTATVAEAQPSELAADIASADRAAKITLWLVIGLSAIAFVVTAGVAVLAMAVGRPLAALRASARAATSGDVRARIKASAPAEVASLAHDFNAMTDALAAKAQEYIDTTNLTGDIILKVGKDGRVTFLNDAACELFGGAREELLGVEYTDYVHPEDVEPTAQIIREAAARKELVRGFVNRVVTPMGTRIVEWNGYPLFDEEGQYAGFQVTGRDISERKRAEELARQAEQRYRDLFEGAPVMYVITRNQDGAPIVADCNELFLSTLGYARAEVAERPLADFYTAESRAELLERGGYERALNGRFAAEERQLLTRDGGIVRTLLRALPEADASGNIFGTRAMYVDVSERKRAEEALRESEEKYRRLVQDSIDGIVMAHGLEISFVNPALLKMLGCESEEEMVGRPFTDFVSPEYRKLMAERAYAREEGQDEPDRYEFKALRKDGSEVYAELSVSRITYEGRVARQAIVRDISERKRAEEALRESEGQYRALFEQAPDSVLLIDPETAALVEFNDRAHQTLGYTREEFEKLRIPDFEATESPGEVAKHMERIIRQGADIFETKHRTKSGEIRYIEIRTRAVSIRGKVFIQTIFHDISERKRAEEELRESEERYRTLFEQAPDSVLLIDGETGALVQFNDKAHETLGYTREEFEKLKIPDFEAIESPEEVAKHIQRIIKEGAGTFETKHRTKSGEIRYIEVRSRAVSVRGKGFNQAIFHDISERKRAEEALRDSEQRFRTLSEATFEGVAIHKKGRILVANQTLAEMFGYQLSEVVGMRPVDFVAPGSRDLVLYATRSGYEEPFELIGLRKDRSIFPIGARGKTTRYQGRTVGVATIRDLSKRKRAEEALQKAREELESRVERRMQQVNGHGLTFRELTVLHLVAAGESDKEIAAVLGITTLTASKHLANILHKMGAASRTEAGVRAVREGLLD